MDLPIRQIVQAWALPREPRGETARYTASYIIASDAALTGEIRNSVTVTASNTADGSSISDVSDDTDDKMEIYQMIQQLLSLI